MHYTGYSATLHLKYVDSGVPLTNNIFCSAIWLRSSGHLPFKIGRSRISVSHFRHQNFFKTTFLACFLKNFLFTITKLPLGGRKIFEGNSYFL